MSKQKSKPNTSGKGSERREEDPKKIWKNWDDIKGFKKSKFK
jgi:hypothetical protein